MLAENAYLLVFASGLGTGSGYTDGGGFIHTNFKLTSGGEFLALVKPDGATIVSQFDPAFPAQFEDVAYGTFTGGGSTSDLIASSAADVLVPSDGSLGLTWTTPSFTPTGWTNGPGNSVGYERSSNNTFDGLSRSMSRARSTTRTRAFTFESRSRSPTPHSCRR